MAVFLPKFGTDKCFALYYKRVLASILNPQISSSIIETIVSLVQPSSNELILYKGPYDYSFTNPVTFDFLYQFDDINLSIIDPGKSPFGIDYSIQELLSSNHKNKNLDIIISLNLTKDCSSSIQAKHLVESCLLSPYFMSNNLNIINSSISTCYHPLYWIGFNLWKCMFNVTIKTQKTSFYLEEWRFNAFYKSIVEIQNMLFNIYHLIIPYQCITIYDSIKNSSNLDNNLITRQFHECVFDKLSQQIIIFGGYGTSISMLNKKKKSKTSKLPRSRLNDIICLKYDNNDKKLIYQDMNEQECKCIPKPRQHHSMVLVKNNNKKCSFIFMFGGRSNPYKPFNDYWLYDINKHKWIELQINKDICVDIPCPRYRHSMCTISDDEIILFGGIGIENKSQKLLNDMYLIKIDFDSLSIGIKQIKYENNKLDPQSIPNPRCSMTVQFINDPLMFSNKKVGKILIFGGLINLNCYQHEMMMNDAKIYVFDLIKQKWNVMNTFNNGPLGLYGQSDCITDNHDNIILSGGIMIEYDPFLNRNKIKYNDNIWKLQISSRIWHCFKINDKLKSKQINIAQKAILFDSTDESDILWLIGGGINVFSFGSVHSSVIQLKLPKY